MAHLTLEYSANLRAGGDFPGLCRKLAAALAAQRDGDRAVFPVGGIRVRALACEDYCIADGAPDAGFVHANLKMGAGRSAAVRTAAGDALFAVLKQHFAAQFAAQGLALSLELNEFREAGTWKHNNLHARLRKG
ncbi:MAG: 5-carboxymethyl-2-hydroxymuconate Delta-isomerase [Gammaproteobacteria bacterium]|nr:5-carboxymethyl-2-hydroxymuconate Delta-isomerase [Gammaproteobacteria bacterium]